MSVTAILLLVMLARLTPTRGMSDTLPTLLCARSTTKAAQSNAKVMILFITSLSYIYDLYYLFLAFRLHIRLHRGWCSLRSEEHTSELQSTPISRMPSSA